MKILATSDLHFRRDWYDWLLQQAPQYEALIIAGDLLDKGVSVLLQLECLRLWVGRMKKTGVSLFLCDGNHDLNSYPLTLPFVIVEKNSPEEAAFWKRAVQAEHWMEALVDEGVAVVSGMTVSFPHLDNLMVTSLYFGSEHKEINTSLLEEGREIRQSRPTSPWIVLHHEPPIGLLGSPELGNQRLGDWITEYQPTMVFCGHDHQSPLVNETCCESLGLTHVYNPGFRSEGDHPCHIDFDTETRKTSWIQ